MSSTLESELNNLIGFFKRSTLTFEIRICKLHFRVTKTSLWRYANFTFYSTTITAVASFTRRDLQHKTSRFPSTSMTTLTSLHPINDKTSSDTPPFHKSHLTSHSNSYHLQASKSKNGLPRLLHRCRRQRQRPLPRTTLLPIRPRQRQPYCCCCCCYCWNC